MNHIEERQYDLNPKEVISLVYFIHKCMGNPWKYADFVKKCPEVIKLINNLFKCYGKDLFFKESLYTIIKTITDSQDIEIYEVYFFDNYLISGKFISELNPYLSFIVYLDMVGFLFIEKEYYSKIMTILSDKYSFDILKIINSSESLSSIFFNGIYRPNEEEHISVLEGLNKKLL